MLVFLVYARVAILVCERCENKYYAQDLGQVKAICVKDESRSRDFGIDKRHGQ